MAGRPTLMTAERFAVILREKRAGRSDREAATAAGVSPRTLYAWMREHPELRKAFDAVVHEQRCEAVRALVEVATMSAPAFQGAA